MIRFRKRAMGILFSLSRMNFFGGDHHVDSFLELNLC